MSKSELNSDIIDNISDCYQSANHGEIESEPKTNTNSETVKETVKETIKCGAKGDPYILTISNELYKMENFNGYCRLFQGKLNEKNLIINAYLEIVSEFEAQEAYETILKILHTNKTDIKNNKLTLEQFKGEAFFRKLYISYDNENMLINMEKLKILENNSNFKIKYDVNISNKFINNTSLDYYHEIEDYSIIVKLTDNVSIIVSTFSNLQIRTGVYILGSKELTNIYGPLVKPMNKENYLIPNLKNVNKITNTRQENLIKGTKIENFVNTNGESIIKYFDIY